MEINLTVEDEIVIRMLRLYTENSFDENLDFSGLYYDEDEFLASLDRCKVAGLAYRMAVEGSANCPTVCSKRFPNAPPNTRIPLPRQKKCSTAYFFIFANKISASSLRAAWLCAN